MICLWWWYNWSFVIVEIFAGPELISTGCFGFLHNSAKYDPHTFRNPRKSKNIFMKSVKEQLGNLDCSPLIPLPGSWMLQNQRVGKDLPQQGSSMNSLGIFFPGIAASIRQQDVVARLAPSMSLIWTQQIGFPRSAAYALKAWHVRWCPLWKLSGLEAVRMVKTLLRHLRKESQCN